MKEFTARHTALSFSWSFDKMQFVLLSQEAQANLLAALLPYGLQPSLVTIEHGERLSDSLLSVVGLLDGRLAVVLSYDHLDFILSDFFVGDKEKIVAILGSLFGALGDGAQGGTGFLKSSSHFELSPEDYASFAADHFIRSDDLIRTSLSYAVSVSNAQGRNFQASVSPSRRFADSIFVEISADYTGEIIPSEFATTATMEFARVLELLDLREK